MAIEIVAPVIFGALEPFALYQALETPAQMRLAVLILCHGGVQIHAAKDLKGEPLPRLVPFLLPGGEKRVLLFDR